MLIFKCKWAALATQPHFHDLKHASCKMKAKQMTITLRYAFEFKFERTLYNITIIVVTLPPYRKLSSTSCQQGSDIVFPN